MPDVLYFSAGVEAGTVVVTNKSFNAWLKQSHEVVGMIKKGEGGTRRGICHAPSVGVGGGGGGWERRV